MAAISSASTSLRRRANFGCAGGRLGQNGISGAAAGVTVAVVVATPGFAPSMLPTSVSALTIGRPEKSAIDTDETVSPAGMEISW